MSSALLIPLADAVTALLNANTFSPAFVATRVYDALRPLETLSDLTVDVVPGDIESDPLDRSRIKNSVHVDIVIRQSIAEVAGTAEETAVLDILMSLVEAIDTYSSAPANRRPPAALWAAWQGSKFVLPYSPKKLREQRLFYSVLRLNYVVVSDGTL